MIGFSRCTRPGWLAARSTWPSSAPVPCARALLACRPGKRLRATAPNHPTAEENKRRDHTVRGAGGRRRYARQPRRTRRFESRKQMYEESQVYKEETVTRQERTSTHRKLAAIGAVTLGLVFGGVAMGTSLAQEPPIAVELLTGRAVFTDDVDAQIKVKLDGRSTLTRNMDD